MSDLRWRFRTVAFLSLSGEGDMMRRLFGWSISIGIIVAAGAFVWSGSAIRRELSSKTWASDRSPAQKTKEDMVALAEYLPLTTVPTWKSLEGSLKQLIGKNVKDFPKLFEGRTGVDLVGVSIRSRYINDWLFKVENASNEHRYFLFSADVLRVGHPTADVIIFSVLDGHITGYVLYGFDRHELQFAPNRIHGGSNYVQ